jgi:serine/threonine protein kinase/tetratricopeptide (TPR) repeat protein
MRTTLEPMLALFNLGGGEIILLLAILLIFALVAVVLGIIIFAIARPRRKSAPAVPQPAPIMPPPTPGGGTEVIPRKCPKCGADLKSDAPEGLCPACLLQRGFATEGGAPPGAPPFTPPSLAELAKLFPQLEILEVIGQGGMGAVYKARQPALDRFVALKILAPRSRSDVDFSSRFSREARALARLSHPNIVAVHDFGTVGPVPSLASPETPAGKSETGRMPVLHYFIMEFVDGPNLRQVEQAGKLTPREALQIIPQICAALQFAHDEGIVHRDIKPENVLLDKKGRVKIADFGLAKILGQEADFRLTGAGDVMGTPHYMAPEQVEKPQEVDHRADIYSLGVVFYEMLTGELPLGKFDPPSHKVQIDVRLDDVVMRSLSKSPERRYQHVSDVRTEIETIAQTPSTGGAPTSQSAFVETMAARDYQLNVGHCLSRGWNLVKQNFWRVVGVNTLVVVLLAFMGSFSLTLSSNWPGAHFGSVLSLILSGPLLGGLYLYFLKLIRGERATVETVFSGFSSRFLQLFLGNFVATLLVVLGFLCLILPGIYLCTAWLFTLILIMDKRLDFWAAMELSRKVITRHWWKFLGFAIVLFLLKFVGFLFCIIGFFIAGPIVHAAFLYAYEDIFGAAAEAKARAAGNAPLAPPAAGRSSGTGWGLAMGAGAAIVLVAFLGLAAAIAIPHFFKARHRAQSIRRQMAANEEERRSPRAKMTSQLAEEGWQLWQNHEWNAAAEKFNRSVQLDPANTNAWNGLGWAKLDAGKTAEAQEAFEKALALDPDYPASLNGLGQIYLAEEKYDDAEKYLLKAAPNAPAAWYGLARLYLLQGNFEQAEKWAQNVIYSGQADEIARQMLAAARQKHLSDSLRLAINPAAAAAQPEAPDTNNATASTETWSPALAPGESPNLQEILSQAKELADTGHYEEALQHHIWYHNNAMLYDQGQTGVRLSFALSDWIDLGRKYPKARQALIEIRDRDTEQFSEGRGNFALFMDVHSINNYLGEDTATYSLFKDVELKDKQLAVQCFGVIEPMLVERGEYNLCLGYMGDPQGVFDRLRASREQSQKWEADQVVRRADEKKRFEEMGQTNPAFAHVASSWPEPPKFADNNFVGQIRQLIEILVGADRKPEADKIRDEALTVLNDDRIKSAVTDAEQKIQKQTQAEIQTN